MRALLALMLLLVLAAPALAAEPQTSLAEIENEVMCTICGTTLGLSESPQANRQKVLIRALVADGLSEDEIKDVLVDEYGPEVLAVPSTEGFDLAAWVVPVLGAGTALILVGGAARRWRHARIDEDRDRPGGATPPTDASAAEEERLRADLGRYDL